MRGASFVVRTGNFCECLFARRRDSRNLGVVNVVVFAVQQIQEFDDKTPKPCATWFVRNSTHGRCLRTSYHGRYLYALAFIIDAMRSCIWRVRNGTPPSMRCSSITCAR